jgi:hypothetical protein
MHHRPYRVYNACMRSTAVSIRKHKTGAGRAAASIGAFTTREFFEFEWSGRPRTATSGVLESGGGLPTFSKTKRTIPFAPSTMLRMVPLPVSRGRNLGGRFLPCATGEWRARAKRVRDGRGTPSNFSRFEWELCVFSCERALARFATCEHAPACATCEHAPACFAGRGEGGTRIRENKDQDSCGTQEGRSEMLGGVARPGAGTSRLARARAFG